MATWKIQTLEYTNNSDKIVTQVHWRCYHSKEDGEKIYTADNYGVVALDEISSDAAGFIAYTDLTEEKCLEWVHAKVNKTRVETAVTDEVTAQLNPPTKTGKPW